MTSGRHAVITLSTYVMLCVGAALVATPRDTALFPVRPSADGRVLVDANGRPFPILGRSSWFMASLSTADREHYIDDSLARGFNSMELLMIGHDPRGRHVPFNDAGDAPFLRRLDGTKWDGSLKYTNAATETPDFTTPNEVFWRGIDALLERLNERGVLAFTFPAYVGYAGNSDQGWMGEMVTNGPARMRAYGEFVARRYARQPNIVWMLGGDFGEFNPAQAAVERAFIEGLMQGAPDYAAKLRSAEWSSESIGTDPPEFGRFITLNGAYSFNGYTADHGRRAFAVTPALPAFLLEEPYDQEAADGTNVNEHATQPVRRFQWWGWLGTIGGYIAGNAFVWPFAGDGWRPHLDTAGSQDMAHMNAFIRSIAWHRLVPSGLGGMRELVTRGGSTVRASDYVAAAASPDGSVLVAYTPPDAPGTFDVDLRVMRGTIRGRWFDPSGGTYRPIAGNVPTTELHTFSTPGPNASGARDWVLVLDSGSSLR